VKIERGVYTNGLRIRMNLESEDVQTHSLMTSKGAEFQQAAHVVGDTFLELIRKMMKGTVLLSDGTTKEEEESRPLLQPAAQKPQIGLAVELPPSLLVHVGPPLTDLDFALAHRVLENRTYGAWFRNRAKGRELILDNSMHELGEPLPLDALIRAAEMVNPDYVIAPDRLDDAVWTLQQYHNTRLALDGRWKTAVVLVGATPDERAAFCQQVQEAEMLCLPYRKPRLAWFLELTPNHRRIHLLGVSTLLELLLWRRLTNACGLDLSVDTGKPVKHGLLGNRISELQSLRHAPLPAKALLEVACVTPEQLDLILENVRFLRTFLEHDDTSRTA
jgi:hypothetical protein